MVCSSNVESLTPAEEFLAKLPDQCPVLYALGNHEYRMLQEPLSSMEYTRYERTLTNAGICFLHNEHVCLRSGTKILFFTGLKSRWNITGSRWRPIWGYGMWTIFWGILPGKAYGSFSPIIQYMEEPIFPGALILYSQDIITEA